MLSGDSSGIDALNYVSRNNTDIDELNYGDFLCIHHFHRSAQRIQ